MGTENACKKACSLAGYMYYYHVLLFTFNCWYYFTITVHGSLPFSSLQKPSALLVCHPYPAAHYRLLVPGRGRLQETIPVLMKWLVLRLPEPGERMSVSDGPK